MATIYCDYASGDDSTGTGTAVNPFKTITQATTGISPGDEVRVAKSADLSSLSGTLAWVDGSQTVVTTADLTGVLAAGDFVGKGTSGETWWEVTAVASGSLTLYRAYSGDTETVASEMLNPTDTGAASDNNEIVQNVQTAGTDGNLIKLSGGWDLSTEEQTGYTWFRQTGSTRYGRGISGQSYFDVENIGCLRYAYGWVNFQYGSFLSCASHSSFYGFIQCQYSVLTSCVSNANSYGYGNCQYGTLMSCTARSNAYHGFATIFESVIMSCIANLNGSSGFSGIFSSVITSCTANSNSINGFDAGYRSTYISCTANSNGGDGFNNCYMSDFLSCTAGSNSIYGWDICYSSLIVQPTWTGGDLANPPSAGYPPCRFQRINDDPDNNRVYFDCGAVVTDTTEKDQGRYCYAFSPTATAKFLEFPVTGEWVATPSGSLTLQCQMKKSSGWTGGTAKIAGYVCGVRVTDFLDVTSSLTTSYQTFSRSVDQVDQKTREFVELRVLVSGTAGTVYADDVAA